MRTYGKAWFDAATPDFAKGLRGGIATLVPFFLATQLQRQELGWMALGGWLGTLVDPGGLRSTRAKTLSAFALAGGVAVAFAEHLAWSPWLAAGGLALVAFVASLFRSLGAVWASAGTMISIAVAIACAKGGADPLRDGLCFAAGAGFATLLSSVIWPIWTHLPLRRAEANVFEALGLYANAIEACVRERTPEGDRKWVDLARRHHRLIRNAVEEARRLALGGRARRAGETRIGSNLRVLLGLAESELPLLVTLKEASELNLDEANVPALLARLREIAKRNFETAMILRAPNLRSDQSTPSIPPPGAAPGKSSSLETLLEHLEDTSRTADALSTHLDARAEDTSAPASIKRRSLHDLLLRWRGDWKTLRDAASPRSTFFHHGVRVGCTVGFAAVLAKYVSLHPHWVTVTTLAVLQPYSGATATRAAQRVLGTVLGSIAAAAITMTVHSPLWLSVVMFPLSVAAVATHRRNYRLFTFFLTPVFVLLAERYQGDWWTAAVRAADAGVGGAIAFVAAVLVFPSRETTRLPDLLANMLDRVGDYASGVLRSVSDRHAEGTDAHIDTCRRSAGIAIAEAESSLERLLAEPRHDMGAEEYALQLITYGRRATGALTTIDTYFARDLNPGSTIAPELLIAIEAYVVGALHRAARFARAQVPSSVKASVGGVTGNAASRSDEAPVPELAHELDAQLKATLGRLLRGAGLVSDFARGGIERKIQLGTSSEQAT